jgi:hypothetical protein
MLKFQYGITKLFFSNYMKMDIFYDNMKVEFYILKFNFNLKVHSQ